MFARTARSSENAKCVLRHSTTSCRPVRVYDDDEHPAPGNDSQNRFLFKICRRRPHTGGKDVALRQILLAAKSGTSRTQSRIGRKVSYQPLANCRFGLIPIDSPGGCRFDSRATCCSRPVRQNGP